MRNLILASSLLLVSFSAIAGLEPLANNELQQIDGQAGADLSLELRLNQTSMGVFDAVGCADLRFCRLGLAVNNRYDDGTQDTYDGDGNRIVSPTGKKLWLVFKGIQGTVNIQHMALDGADLTYGNIVKPAIQLGFNPLKPIQIRNLGFSALSIETDTGPNETGTPGYLASTTYASAATFDGVNPLKPATGRETGFTGLNIHGNLSVAGTIKIFSCDGSHPRC